MEILRAEALTKTYGQGASAAEALRGVTFSVEQGSFTAIVGRSGSGKTTLLNLLGGLDTPTSGRVLCRGQSLYELPPRRRDAFRRRHIGFVFQFFNLVPEFTARETICLLAYFDGRVAADGYVDDRDPDEDFVNELLDKLELGDKAGRYPAELSGGEQQRVAVARALAQKPAILLADEPTGNLDRKSGRQLMELLHFSHRSYHQTILLVTHDMELARETERLLVLSDGQLVSDWKGEVL